jgi:uncharacterized protein (DUF4415 family)
MTESNWNIPNNLKQEPYYTNFEKFDAHVITQEEYDDIPEITLEMMQNGVYRENGIVKPNPFLARGRPKVEAKKASLHIRLAEEVIEGFRKTGKGWQSRMEQALKDHLSQSNKI